VAEGSRPCHLARRTRSAISRGDPSAEALGWVPKFR
jgi:hypothetical protein